MSKLVINPDTPDAWEMQLNPGVNSIGRNPENDFPVEHSSVSGEHCRITVLDSRVVIEDLGSTGGTFVNGMLVEKAFLVSGQTVRLGEIAMRFEAAPGAAPASGPAPAETTTLPANVRCKYHPKTFAAFICPKCHVTFCHLCVNARAGQDARFCRTCAVECAALPPPVVEAPGSEPLRRQIGQAFSYPFKGNGPILLIAGTAFYVILELLMAFSGIVGLILGVIATGYLIAFMQQILVTSAAGDDAMPDWPDFTGVGDAFSPLIQFAGTGLVSFGAVIALPFLAPGHPALGWGMAGAALLGCIYFPMAFTAVTMFDSLSALNPLLIVPSIVRIALAYSVVVVLLGVVFIAGSFGSEVLSRLIPFLLVPSAISHFCGLYILAVEMRLLGVLYRTKKAELGWFRH